MALSVTGTPVCVRASSITLPTHSVGDMILLYAYLNGGAGFGNPATPTKPTATGTVPAWVDIDNNTGANGCSSRTAYFVATATNTTSGTWTGGSGMCAIVLRGQAAAPIGGHAESGGTATNSALAPSVTMTKTDGTSFLVQFYGLGATGGSNNGFSAAPPTGYTNSANTSGGATTNIATDTKNVTTSDGGVTRAADSIFASLGYRGAQIEILAAVATANHSGFFPLIMA